MQFIPPCRFYSEPHIAQEQPPPCKRVCREPPERPREYAKLREAVEAKRKDEHLFAVEYPNASGAGSYRRFISVLYQKFWNYYSSLDDEQKHFYELIPENTPCKLYFDLEYMKKYNDTDEQSLVKLFLSLVEKHLQKCFPDFFLHTKFRVIQLEASTSQKFSQHLVSHLQLSVLSFYLRGLLINYLNTFIFNL